MGVCNTSENLDRMTQVDTLVTDTLNRYNNTKNRQIIKIKDTV